MDDKGLDTASAQPTGQPESIPAGLESQNNPTDHSTDFHRMIPPTKRSSAVGSGSNFFKGRLPMPRTTPAASQLDWLISSTTTMVLFCSKVIRERLRSSTWVMGGPSIDFAQRQRCQTFAAVPIASGPGADIRASDQVRHFHSSEARNGLERP